MKSTSIFIGLRYILAKKNNRVVSFTSLISMAGITLGVLALIIVLSVFNGSQGIIRDRTLITVPHGDIYTEGRFPAWEDAADLLESRPSILAVAPYVTAEALLSQRGNHQVTQIKGIVPDAESRVSNIEGSMLQGSLFNLSPGRQGVILERMLANNLRLFVGDSVNLLVPQIVGTGSRIRVLPYSFDVVGIFDVGLGPGSELALIHLQDSLPLLGVDDPAEAVRLRLQVDDIYKAADIVRNGIAALRANFPGPLYEGQDWSVSEANLFNALRMEKVMTWFMLMMIVAIGAFNIVSTLVMVVQDKQADIAILRTMGASKNVIMGIFVVQGFVVGICGTVLGAVLGILIAFNFSTIGDLIEILLIPDGLYVLSALPTEVQLRDVVLTCLSALLISFLATLYPAWKASRVLPAEVLRYE